MNESIAAKETLAADIAAEQAALIQTRGSLQQRCDSSQSKREAVDVETAEIIETCNEKNASLESVRREAMERGRIAK